VLRRLSLIIFGLYLIAVAGMIAIPALGKGGQGVTASTSERTRISFSSLLHNTAHPDEDGRGALHRDLQLPLKMSRVTGVQFSIIESFQLAGMTPVSYQIDPGYQPRNSGWRILSSYQSRVFQPPRA